jgi:hypothetical protein
MSSDLISPDIVEWVRMFDTFIYLRVLTSDVGADSVITGLGSVQASLRATATSEVPIGR